MIRLKLPERNMRRGARMIILTVNDPFVQKILRRYVCTSVCNWVAKDFNY
jgi:hypothetical protein